MDNKRLVKIMFYDSTVGYQIQETKKGKNHFVYIEIHGGEVYVFIDCKECGNSEFLIPLNRVIKIEFETTS